MYKSVLQFLYWCVGHDEEQESKKSKTYRDDIAEIEASLKKNELALEESSRRIAENISARQELSRKMDALEEVFQQHDLYVNQPLGLVDNAIPSASDNNKQKN
jgi:hypothetical protein